MPSSRVEFITESIDLASFLATAGYSPTIFPNPTGTRAVFCFIETDRLHQEIVNFERGASLPAKKLLNIRSRLFREASMAVREGHGR
jgi:hypothetical protein